jgi:hypothetical protein
VRITESTTLTAEVLKAIGVDPEDAPDLFDALTKQMIFTVGDLRSACSGFSSYETGVEMLGKFGISFGPAAAILRFFHGKHLRWSESQKLRMGLKLLH